MIALAEDTEVLITGIALVDLMLGASLAVSVDIKGFDSDRFDDLTVSYRDGQRGSYGDLHISNAPMAGGRISIDISGSVPAVQGLPEGMQLYHGHRPWMTELVEQADSDERLNERLPARQPSVELIPGPRSRPR